MLGWRAYDAIHQNANVKFTFNVESFFDQKAVNDASFLAGLWRHQFHAEYVLRVGGNFVRGLCQLDPTSFSTTAGVNLSFDYHYWRAEPLRSRSGFVFLGNHFAARDRNAKFREDCFGLVLVDFHLG